ncbi:MAG: hypothetical protein BM485_06565 [Desulfobulbaceae bacterium DB1]|nr:MAG: hypothetical protein BM485_06565 [Desulfobulbaceae bacterium DB1]
MHRFFIDPEDTNNNQAILRGREAHHLCKVLRLQAGAAVELLDGRGAVYQAEVAQTGHDVFLTILSREIHQPDSPSLTIAQGLLKGQKMDFLAQKANELGVTAFLPFSSDHCAVTPPKEMKRSRWEKIVLESCKQCGRPVPLQLGEVVHFNTLLAESTGYDKKIILWEKETESRLHDIGPPASSLSVIALIGPEGGFSKEEVNRAELAGFLPVSLGKRTLRAETAALSAMAVLQFLGGNL